MAKRQGEKVSRPVYKYSGDPIAGQCLRTLFDIGSRVPERRLNRGKAKSNLNEATNTLNEPPTVRYCRIFGG